MKFILYTLIYLFSISQSFSQKSVVKEFGEVDKKVMLIPDSLTNSTDGIATFINENFTNENEKARAIFFWIASTIRYDIDNMYAVNFYEKKEAKIASVLKTKKGICEHYAELFNEICTKSGIKSVVITGFTREDGQVSTISHAWNGVQLDGKWWVFDPTWGAGYVFNTRFFKKLNNDYFKAYPSVRIQSHMPFDYLWQFLNYPVSNQEFYDGKTKENKSKPFFSYADSIEVYQSLSHIEQLGAIARRMEITGMKNSLIFDYYQHLKAEVENDKQEKKFNLYNSAVSDYNSGIRSFNDFIKYKNKQFKPIKSDPEIQSMLDSSKFSLDEGKRKLSEVKNPNEHLTSSMIELTKSIEDVSVQIREQQDWLTEYFGKSKLSRKNMFYERKSIFSK